MKCPNVVMSAVFGKGCRGIGHVINFWFEVAIGFDIRFSLYALFPHGLGINTLYYLLSDIFL